MIERPALTSVSPSGQRRLQHANGRKLCAVARQPNDEQIAAQIAQSLNAYPAFVDALRWIMDFGGDLRSRRLASETLKNAGL